MHAETKKLSETKFQLTITAGPDELTVFKNATLTRLGAKVKLSGFREGKAPLNLVEKNIDQQLLQTEFLELALSELYAKAAQAEKIRPAARPEVNVKKFVPFSALEFEVIVEAIGDIKLPNYKTMKLAKPEAKVTAEDVNKVLESLRTRMAEKSEVKRAAKDGDQATIDFNGVDTKSKPVSGADGKDYPLLLGSGAFIPGFEDNVIGMKAGEEKTFDVIFPKDYGVSALQNKKVTFTVNLKKLEELNLPKVDDALAAKVGPFKTVSDLKSDIKKQLAHERKHEVDRNYHNELVGKIVDKTEMVVPGALIEQQVIYNLDEVRRNLTYRGQTYQEFLAAEGLTEDQYKDTIVRPQAERQVKTSLVLSELADKEGLVVTPEELEIRLQLLKGQYQDPAMQAELDKPENRSDIASRLLTEKVVAKLEQYASSKS